MAPDPVCLARHAMATRFEIVLHGDRPDALRAAGEEALDEIDRIENQLSLYRSYTEIAAANTRAAGEPVRVSPPVFRLLEHARTLSAETNGAFDITIGPLVRCWGFMGGTGRQPAPEALAAARAAVGMAFVRLDTTDFTVRFLRPGVMLDLGAIGKGYAIDRAVEILRDAGVTSGLIHAGTSTIYAIGAPPDGQAWKVALESRGMATFQPTRPPPGGTDNPSVESTKLAVVSLRDEALSVSAVWGRAFQRGDRTYGHVIDPRSGEPVDRARLAALILPLATESDALSTALLTLGPAGLETLHAIRPAGRMLVLGSNGNVSAHGIEPSAAH